MSHLAPAAAVGLLTLLALGGCSAASSAGAGHPATHQLTAQRATVASVDTPALRRQKAASGIANCPAHLSTSAKHPGGLPAITLPCLGGGPSVNLAAIGDGQPAVVNFWSQTCGPCRDESPLIETLHRRAGPRLQVLGVDWLDPRPSYAIALAHQLGLTYPQLADPGGATRVPLRISGLPITCFVNSHGRLVHTQYGAMTSEHQLVALVHRYLGVRL